MSETLSRYAPQARAIFRIAVALLFIQHGTQKLLGFPAAAQPMPLNGLFITGGLARGDTVTDGTLDRARLQAFLDAAQMSPQYAMIELR